MIPDRGDAAFSLPGASATRVRTILPLARPKFTINCYKFLYIPWVRHGKSRASFASDTETVVKLISNVKMG